MKTIEELANKINMSVSWVDKRIREGKISAVWFGGKRMISQEEFDRVQREGVR